MVTLVKCLCRFVWSEHTHEKRESATARKAEEAFLREQGLHHGAAPSAEDRVARVEAERKKRRAPSSSSMRCARRSSRPGTM